MGRGRGVGATQPGGPWGRGARLGRAVQFGGDLLAGSAAQRGVGRPGVLVVVGPSGRIRGRRMPVA